MAESDPSEALGGARALVFATTHWSVVLQAGGQTSSQSSAALEQLCRTYWPPIYAFLRRKGHREDEAKDLTQGFFRQLLERGDFQRVEARKGKFRTFLLASLSHFVSNERDFASAQKRGGGRAILSLDELSPEQFQRLEPASDLSPDKLFDQRWALTLLETAVGRLREELRAADKQSQFECLKQFLTTEPDEGDYAAAAQQLVTTSQAIAVMVHRMRRRYCELVRAELANTVSSPTEVEAEMRYLLIALNPT